MEHHVFPANPVVPTRGRAWASLLTLISFALCAGDLPPNAGLARLLAGHSPRDRAVAQLVASGDSSLPLLLSWAEHAPPQVDREGLYIGLADVFAGLQ